LLINTSVNALTVPSAAVRHGQTDLFVYIVRPDQTVVRQQVEVERDDGVTAIISKGLEEGQTAVTDGQSRLQNGTRVSIINGDPKQAANPAREGG
jgi:multidrug efflux system membrane fusion protein